MHTVTLSYNLYSILFNSLNKRGDDSITRAEVHEARFYVMRMNFWVLAFSTFRDPCNDRRVNLRARSKRVVLHSTKFIDARAKSAVCSLTRHTRSTGCRVFGVNVHATTVLKGPSLA